MKTLIISFFQIIVSIFRILWSKTTSLFSKIWQKRTTFSITKASSGIQDLVATLLKLGTLILVVIVVFWLLKEIRKDGYIIQPFDVPKHLEESGFDGVVVARKMQDKVAYLKKEAGSAKKDSIQLIGNEAPDLNISMMSVGLSLSSLTYHLRSLFGKKNKTIRGEIIYLDSTYTLTLRMSEFEPVESQAILEIGNQRVALEKLIQNGAESIVKNIDPYRLAVFCYRKKRYKDGMKAVQYTLNSRPKEAHWAYLAWGSILEELEEDYAAARKFERAVRIKPDFEIGWVRLSWIYNRLKQEEKAHNAMLKVLEISPNNVGRLMSAAWMFVNADRYELADSLFKRATIVDPQNPMVWTGWADSKLSRGKEKEAKELILKAEKYLNNNAEGLLIQGFSRFMQQDTIKAIEYISESFELNPAFSPAASNLMNGYYALKDYGKIIEVAAQADWDNMKGDSYQKARAYNIWASAHLQKEEYEIGESILREAIAEFNYFPMLYATLAERFLYENQVDSFYHYLQISFDKGFESEWLEDEVKEVVKDESRFKELVAKYEKPKLKG